MIIVESCCRVGFLLFWSHNNPNPTPANSMTSSCYLFCPGIQVLAAPSWLLFEPYEFVTDRHIGVLLRGWLSPRGHLKCTCGLKSCLWVLWPLAMCSSPSPQSAQTVNGFTSICWPSSGLWGELAPAPVLCWSFTSVGSFLLLGKSCSHSANDRMSTVCQALFWIKLLCFPVLESRQSALLLSCGLSLRNDS